MVDCFTPQQTFEEFLVAGELYFVMELMPTDLNVIIKFVDHSHGFGQYFVLRQSTHVFTSFQSIFYAVSLVVFMLA